MNTFKHLSMVTASAALLAYGTVAPTQAAQLGTADLNINGEITVPNAIRGDVRLTLSISDDPEVPSPIVQPQINLFEGTIITPTDIGRTFTATPEQEPNFNNFASLLTDGRRSVVGISVDFLDNNNSPSGFGIGLNENSFSGSGVGAVDFLGNTIDSIDLRINSFDISNTKTASEISLGTTLTINGQPESTPYPVPEPASNGSILAFAILGAAYMLKRQRGRC